MENLAKPYISELAPRGRSDFCGDFSTKKTCFTRTRTEHRIFNVFQIIFTRSTRMEWKTYENLRKPQNSLHADGERRKQRNCRE